jgi:GNAT superfamily N-acetyltransferase
MTINYTNDDTSLAIGPFLELVDRVWPGEYDRQKTAEAIDRTLNVTAWDDERLVGCVRLLTDGYFFGCITEILVDPDYQGHGIGRELMERAWDASPTSSVDLKYDPSFSAHLSVRVHPCSRRRAAANRGAQAV